MLNISTIVVRRNLYWARGSNVRLSADQRFRRVSVCRGRNTIVIMGTGVIPVESTL